MKRIYILTILFALAVVAANAQVSKVFDQYSDTRGVTSVYISKAMLGMMPDIQSGKVELKGMTDKLDYIRVLTTQRTQLATQISNSIKMQLNHNKYETLISTNDGNNKVNIYMKSHDKGVNEYIIVTRNLGELNVVLISGTITPADLQKMNLK